MISTDYPTAQNLVRHYCCSDCWGFLAMDFDKEDREVYNVQCGTEGCPCRSIVSTTYAARRSAESHAELFSARHALADAIPWLKEEAQEPARKFTKEREAEIIRSLGY